MPAPDELEALARRCEAEAPSWELDQEIARWFRHNDYAWWRERTGRADFTSSLDAALTLVPPKHGVVAAWSDESAMFTICSMPLGTVEGQGWFPQCKAPTPAAALTAASLRARAADMQARFAPHPSRSA